MSTGQRSRPVTRRYSGQPRRIADADFHLWPNLAWKCPACRWPVDQAAAPVHPCCEVTS